TGSVFCRPCGAYALRAHGAFPLARGAHAVLCPITQRRNHTPELMSRRLVRSEESAWFLGAFFGECIAQRMVKGERRDAHRLSWGENKEEKHATCTGVCLITVDVRPTARLCSRDFATSFVLRP